MTNRFFGMWLALLLTGCASGHSATAVPARVPVTGPLSAIISFVVPKPASAARRRPTYISPGTQSVAVSVNGGTPVIVNTTGPGPYSIVVPSPPGTSTFAVSAYQGANASGNVLSQGTASQDITANSTVNVVLRGVVANVSNAAFVLSSVGPPQIWTVNVTARDASNNVITGPYATPLTLTNTDVSGQTTLSTTLVDGVTAPTLTYNVTGYSGACNFAALTLSGAGPPLILNFAKGNRVVTTPADAGAGSLRQQITLATAGETVAVPQGTINPLSAMPPLASGVSVCGSGPGSTIIDGTSAGTNGLFTAVGGATVNIAGLTVRNFYNSVGGGALVFSSGTFTINNCDFNHNTGGSYGGAIRQQNGSLTLSNSSFSANGGSSSSGGGLAVLGGSTTINNTTFNANTSGGDGGAIDVLNTPTITINSSTFSNNAATGTGGAMYVQGGTTTINNSTIVGNTACCSGAIYTSGVVTLVMSTIVGNTSTQIVNGGTVNIRQSIVAGAVGAAQEMAGTITSQDYNLIQGPVGGSIVGVTGNNIYGVSPNLGGLGFNGGLTQTMRPNAGSQVIDKIPSGSCAFLVDQRGATFARGGDGFCDIGAFET